MSRGPGTVQRRILALFQENPRAVISTSDLCRQVFKSVVIAKKHRVSVLRALSGIRASRLKTLECTRLEFERDDVWFDAAVWRVAPGRRQR